MENCFPFPSNFSPGHDSGLGGRVKAPTPRSSQDKPWKNNFTRFVRFRAKGKLKGRSFSPLGGNELARPLDEIDGQFLAGGDHFFANMIGELVVAETDLYSNCFIMCEKIDIQHIVSKTSPAIPHKNTHTRCNR